MPNAGACEGGKGVRIFRDSIHPRNTQGHHAAETMKTREETMKTRELSHSQVASQGAGVVHVTTP